MWSPGTGDYPTGLLKVSWTFKIFRFRSLLILLPHSSLQPAQVASTSKTAHLHSAKTRSVGRGWSSSCSRSRRFIVTSVSVAGAPNDEKHPTETVTLMFGAVNIKYTDRHNQTDEFTLTRKPTARRRIAA